MLRDQTIFCISWFLNWHEMSTKLRSLERFSWSDINVAYHLSVRQLSYIKSFLTFIYKKLNSFLYIKSFLTFIYKKLNSFLHIKCDVTFLYIKSWIPFYIYKMWHNFFIYKKFHTFLHIKCETTFYIDTSIIKILISCQ